MPAILLGANDSTTLLVVAAKSDSDELSTLVANVVEESRDVLQLSLSQLFKCII